MTNKIYIVIDACSGEDYSTDEPNVLFVTTDFKKAKQFFEDEISNWEDGMTDFDSSNDGLYYDCTDFEGDSHRVMKIVEREF